jgi:menaquinone-9 beta-reductase
LLDWVSRVKNSYDVIVAGAGPAGSFTAALLADSNHDVLLLDKKSFPRDKTCGDGLSSGVMDILVQAGLEPEIEEALQNGNFYPLTHMNIVTPAGKKLVAPLAEGNENMKPCVARRTFFDTLLQRYALKMGAEFQNFKVLHPLVEKGTVVGVEVEGQAGTKQIEAKVVVGAEGISSPIAKTLRNSNGYKDRHQAIAIRAYLEGIQIKPHQAEFFLYKEILPGYAWIFPIGENKANIGLGMRLDYYHKTKGSLKSMLQAFMQFPDIKERLLQDWRLADIASWPLNFGSQKGLQYVFNGALLVGDAAGFISPLTGGGIHRSLLSACLASETIKKALSRGDLSRGGLLEYEHLCRKNLLADLRHLYYAQNLLLHFPALINPLFSRNRTSKALIRLISKKL